MKTIQLVLLLTLLTFGTTVGQTYYAGFKSLQLKDSTRVYKPDTEVTDNLHYRPVDLDIWYPSEERKGKALKFGDLFSLFEQRAINYQDNEDYSGLTKELAQFYVAELGVGTDGQKLLNIETNSFPNLEPSATKQPVIIYMAGLNGMGFENYKVLEKLAQNGYFVVSIWSVGRYPGDMTNQREDMMEQVYDAEFAIRYLKECDTFNLDLNNIGIIGYSWGGMSSAVFVDRSPNVNAFVSLDGTETHYFGEDDESDQSIQEIYDSELFNPQTQDITYLYLESGDKLDDFEPSKDYNYFRELNSEKSYLRFKKSTHADFTCIPAILEYPDNSVTIYENIENLTVAFFKKSLENKGSFQSIWDKLKTVDDVTEEPYEISTKKAIESEISGTVTDKENHEPLRYVNIGILNKETGTVTDIDGKFTLFVKEEFENDTIRISSIGYKPFEVLVKDLQLKEQPVLINLEEQVNELDEVVVTAKAFRKKTLGNKTESKFYEHRI